MRVASIPSNRPHRPLMACNRNLPLVITKLKAWRALNNLSQSHAVHALVAAGLPIKLRTLQTWEIGQSSPQPVTAAALKRFLSEQEQTSLPQRTPAPVILRLKAWREANNLSILAPSRQLPSRDFWMNTPALIGNPPFIRPGSF